MGHSPGLSINSFLHNYETAPEESEPFQFPAPEPQILPSQTFTRPSRKSSLQPVGIFEQTLQKKQSPKLGYDAPASPQVAVARQVSVAGVPKAQYLVRSTSKRLREEPERAKIVKSDSRAGTPTMVVVDNSDRPDEETWLQRRSQWGIIEEGDR